MLFFSSKKAYISWLIILRHLSLIELSAVMGMLCICIIKEGTAYPRWLLSLFSRSVLSDRSSDLMDCSTQASLSLTVSQGWLKFMSIELVMSFNHLILCCSLLLPSIFPNIRVLSNESTVCIRWTGMGASASVLPINI